MFKVPSPFDVRVRRRGSQRNFSFVHCLAPFPICVLTKDQRFIARNHKPGTGQQLSLELARRPTCIAQNEQRLHWTFSLCHGLYEFGIRRHCDAISNLGGLFEHDIITMKHKACARTDGTTVMDDDLTLRVAAVNAETFEQVFYGTFRQWPVDDQTEGAFRVVLHHIYDRFDKSRVSHFRSRYEQLSSEII